MGKFIVLDVVFYASSLNYDQGSGNIQELKKITKWDGKQYTFVSRYALRYSILHHAHSLFGEKWPLAGKEQLKLENGGVVQANGDAKELVKNFPEFDFFGYMMTKSGQGADTRPAVAALSHAISLVPFNYDSHFNANLDVRRRSGNSGSNPFTIEEHYSYYIYSVVIDLNRLGTTDGTDIVDDSKKVERIEQLMNTILTLKRQIKGRVEDLAPKLMVVGLYNETPYKSFKDKIALANEYEEEITQTEEKIEGGTKIFRRIVKTNKPRFEVYDLGASETYDVPRLITKVSEFSKKDGGKDGGLLFYKDAEIEVGGR